MDAPVNSNRPPRTPEDITELLASASFGSQKVGLEVETGVLRQSDLAPARFDGPDGIEALLEHMFAEGSWTEATRESGRLIGLKDGLASITIEPGGQLELSSRPHPDLLSLAEDYRSTTGAMARAADAKGLLLIGGGLQATTQDAAPWMPKARYKIMRDYFASLGEGGRLAHTMMQRTLSVQVSVDYTSAEDAAEILRLAFWAAAPTTAIFAASPFEGTDESGFLSTRGQAWRYTDPARSGEVARCATPGSTLTDWVEYALDVPMMFRIRGHDYVAEHGASFREVLGKGHWPEDASPLALDDVWNHMGGIFTDARLKRGLVELRSSDGQLPDEVMAVPAYWVGLLYDPTARAELAELLGGVDAADREQALDTVPRFALSAAWGSRPMIDVARELIGIARRGLERRIEAGHERPGALELLAPVERRLREGRTPAEELLEQWRGRWQRSHAKLIDALRFKA